MSAEKLKYAAIALVFLLAAFSILLFLDVKSLEGRLSSQSALLEQERALAQSKQRECEAQSFSLKAQLDNSNRELKESQQKIALLQAELEQANLAIAESKERLEAQKKEAELIMESLDSLEKRINESISWFKENSHLPSNYSWVFDPLQRRILEGFKQRLLEDCVHKGGLNLACVSHLMENSAFAIHYRKDIASGKSDYLQSVKETISIGWGDCEDYSLLFKAILNSIKSSDPALPLIAWAPSSSGGEFRVYPKEAPGESTSYYYYPNAKAVWIDPPYRHSYVVCYLQDPYSGHCTVALSKSKINSSSQMGALYGAVVFEPQSGLYLGEIGKSFSLCSHRDCFEEPNNIWLVISDEDLYSYEEEGWVGYSDYLSLIKSIKNK